MRWTLAEYLDYQRRRQPAGRLPGPPQEAVDRELALHDEIMRWCDAQWPRWKYVRARPDQPSSIQPGAQDFTVFGPWPLCVLVECKRRGGKPSAAQQSWGAELGALGWRVCIVHSLNEFHAAVELARLDYKASQKL